MGFALLIVSFPGMETDVEAARQVASAVISGLLLFLAFLGWRNNRVCNFRQRVIDLAYDHIDWQRRRDVFLSISYERMLCQFWRPLTVEEWYGDRLPKPGPGEDWLKRGEGI